MYALQYSSVTNRRLLAALLLATALPLQSVLANEEREHRQHGAHEHGAATLNLAQEGTDIHVELQSPAANIVGFEHAPSTDTEHKALEQAVETLKDGARLLRFEDDAECRLVESRVESPLLETDQGKADEHDEGHRHAEKQEHDEHESHAEAHADILAEYRFSCARPEKLGRMDVMLFEAFPAIDDLDTNFVTDRGQGNLELTAADPTVKF